MFNLWPELSPESFPNLADPRPKLLIFLRREHPPGHVGDLGCPLKTPAKKALEMAPNRQGPNRAPIRSSIITEHPHVWKQTKKV